MGFKKFIYKYILKRKYYRTGHCTYLEVIDKDDNGLVFKCNKFDKEKKICTIHKFRPGICRRYPSEVIFKMGAVMSEDCGFKFTPIESFSQVFEQVKKKYKN